MDLYAFTQIENYENDLKDILPHIPRLRGIRKMSEEKPLSDPSYQIERFNSYCGEEKVYMIHTRIGGNNWDYYGGDSITKFPWFVERVDDDFDNTYCDIYVRIR